MEAGIACAWAAAESTATKTPLHPLKVTRFRKGDITPRIAKEISKIPSARFVMLVGRRGWGNGRGT
jgi:hypothetical protein